MMDYEVLAQQQSDEHQYESSKVAVMFSGGVCSYLAAARFIDQTGLHPRLLFSDTGVEDETLYEFVRESADLLECELVTVNAGFTFDEMIVRHKALPSNMMPFCSHELKIKPAKRYVAEHPEIDTLVFGIDWTEPHRLPKVQNLWIGYKVVVPMMDNPYLTKTQMIEQVKADGLTVPRLYDMGFQHNNCGGGCVRNGLTAWAHLYNTLPERYAEWEAREKLIPGYSFAKEKRNGKARRITLSQIRERQDSMPRFDWGGCGCFLEEA